MADAKNFGDRLHRETIAVGSPYRLLSPFPQFLCLLIEFALAGRELLRDLLEAPPGQG